jgi:hypothetical protein
VGDAHAFFDFLALNRLARLEFVGLYGVEAPQVIERKTCGFRKIKIYLRILKPTNQYVTSLNMLRKACVK